MSQQKHLLLIQFKAGCLVLWHKEKHLQKHTFEILWTQRLFRVIVRDGFQAFNRHRHMRLWSFPIGPQMWFTLCLLSTSIAIKKFLGMRPRHHFGQKVLFFQKILVLLRISVKHIPVMAVVIVFRFHQTQRINVCVHRTPLWPRHIYKLSKMLSSCCLQSQVNLMCDLTFCVSFFRFS